MRICNRLTLVKAPLKVLSASAVCATLVFAGFSAVAAQSDVYLPHVSFRDLTCVMPNAQPTAERGSDSYGDSVSQKPNTARILPMGLHLDDVGQYYSQVAPSLSSTIIISDTAAVSQTYSLELFGDTGYKTRAYNGCNLPANSVHEWKIVGGELMVRVVDSAEYDSSSVADICNEVTQGRDEFGRLESSLHGVYHAVVRGHDSALREVRVRTVTDETYPEIRTYVETEYRAANIVSSRTYVPGVLATRDTSNYWDTELIVQNTTGFQIDINFEFCDARGDCFDNNLTRLGPHERRILLASHLLYEPTRSGLVERRGWYSAVIRAVPSETTGEEARVAVAVNLFRQKVDPDRVRPQAENGSICLYSITPSAPIDHFEYSVGALSPTQIRLYNPSNSTVEVRVGPSASASLHIRESWLAIGPRETQTVPVQIKSNRVVPGTVQGDSLESQALNPGRGADLLIDASSPIAAFAWDDAGPIQTNNQPDGSDWYAPLVAAPVTPFQWDSERNAGEELVPSAAYGLSETVPRVHELRPDWARRLNWYDARYDSLGYDRQFCNETYDSETPVSFHIPLWRKLGPCGVSHANDRTCLNTDQRLRKLRNTLPSSCAGRPLFIANEPDLSSQGFMTYHELGRLIYVLRDWPGQLFTPAFASYDYENPVLPPEGDSLCRRLVAEDACPGADGCDLCVRDGVFDGELDPLDISLKGLEAYFGEEGRWARGQSWKLEDTVEGLLVHFYNGRQDELNDSHWRIPYLHRYRERALEAGWPIVVKEYGFAVWPNEFGEEPGFTASSIAAQVDDIRRFLQRHLGGVGSGPGKLKKMFWYQTGCESQGKFWSLLCLFSGPTIVTEPVGRCWYEDAIGNDLNDGTCGQSLD
jgi:hypothetical protein